jgi:hypothetical protein
MGFSPVALAMSSSIPFAWGVVAGERAITVCEAA